jgi:transcriptional regulator with XRE-family HTH domain
MNVGEKIKKLRELKNYTQQHMAEELDLSLSGYGKIERNETDISVSKLEKIAKILETDISSILSFDEKHVFNISENKQANVSMRDQYINQLDLIDRIIAQYREEIQFLKDIIKDLTAKL